MNPDKLSSRDFAEWNEEMVRRYDIERYYDESHALIRWLERRRLALLKDFAAARQGDRILEVGCGAGHVLQQFHGCDRTGIDLSTAMIGRARARLGEGVTLLRASGEKLPFDAGIFDVVLCTEVLEHTPDPRQVIAELMRVAAPGARVLVSIPNERNIDRIKRLLGRIPGIRRILGTLAAEGNEWHLHHFDRQQLHESVAGLAEVSLIRGVPHAAMPLRFIAQLARPTTQRPSDQ